MRLSIVATLYKSAGNIEEFYQRSMATAEALGLATELILVNDGSPDDSLDLALALHRRDPRVTIVDLSRNFGHHKAMMTGLAYADGDLVFLIDSDLDEEPELLAAFYERLRRDDCDVVYGYQERRRGGIFERATGEIYYWLVKTLSDDVVPRNHITARLMRRRYVKALVEHQDRSIEIQQLWSATGFTQVGLPVRKLSRSPTTYTVALRLEYLVRHLATSSTRLLHYIFYLGLALSLCSSLVIVYFLARYAASGITVSGFTSVIVSVWFFGGLLTFIMGVQGLYIASIFSETKRRPFTVVRAVHKAAAAVAEAARTLT